MFAVEVFAQDGWQIIVFCCWIFEDLPVLVTISKAIGEVLV